MEIWRPLAFSTHAISSQLAHSSADIREGKYFLRVDHGNSLRIVGEFQRIMLLFVNDKTFSELMFCTKLDRVDIQARDAPVLLPKSSLRELAHNYRLQHAVRRTARDSFPVAFSGRQAGRPSNDLRQRSRFRAYFHSGETNFFRIGQPARLFIGLRTFASTHHHFLGEK